MQKIIIPLLLLLVIASRSPAADKAREGQEDDIREAVFRYQIDHYNCVPRKVYFLGISHMTLTNYLVIDPSAELMKRFVDHKPPVRKFSSGRFAGGFDFVDKKTGEEGVDFSVESDINWISDTVVVVKGTYPCPVAVSEDCYTVKKVNGKWAVTYDDQHLVTL